MNDTRHQESSPLSMRVLLLGFTPIERTGLQLLLAEGGLDVVASITTTDAFSIHFLPLDVVLIDLTALDELQMLSARDRHLIDRLRGDAPEARLVGIGRPSGRPDRVRRLGLDAVLDAEARPEAVLSAVAGHGPTRRVWRTPTLEPVPLTIRERQILALIAAGSTAKAIASELGVSEHTVDRHKQRLFRRLGVTNQAQAVSVALHLGLLPATDGPRSAAS